MLYRGGGKISIGNFTFVNYACFFDTSQMITIGDNVNIAMRCTFITSTHKIGASDHRASTAEAYPIIIGNGCWIGAGVTILPGVNVGEGTIIAAGSVVVKNCAPNSLYAGVPAKKIKEL